MTTRTLSNFVAGGHADATDGRTSELVDPVTGEVFMEAALSSEADVDRACRAAAEAFKHTGNNKDLSMYGLEDYTRIKHVMSYIGT